MSEFWRPHQTSLQILAISAYRDALLRQASRDDLLRLSTTLDPETKAWLDLFAAARHEAIAPDPAFVRRLDRIVAQAPGPSQNHPAFAALQPLRRSEAPSLNGHHQIRRGPAPPQPSAWRAWRHTGLQVSMAALTMILIVGSLVAALYPLYGQHLRPFALIAPVRTTDETMLLDVTLTEADIPPFRIEGGLAITEYPDGGSSTAWASPRHPQVFVIAAGRLRLTVTDAPQPVRLIQPGQDAPHDALMAGQDAVLPTGTMVIAPGGTKLEFLNEGPEAATKLDVLSAPTSAGAEQDGARANTSMGAQAAEIVPPVSLGLRQITIAPGETLPAPIVEGVAQSAVPVDIDQLYELRSNLDGSFVNPGSEPLAIYVLTVEGTAPPSIPASASRP